MKKIAVVALKGGVGKSSVVAGLGLALVDKVYKVGLIDIDVTGSNLYSALGLETSPKWGLDSKNEKIIVPKVNGYWLLSFASHSGEDHAVLWDSAEQAEFVKLVDAIKCDDEPPGFDRGPEIDRLRQTLDNIQAGSKWRVVKELLSDDVVTWPVPLDFLIIDCPPSSSHEIFALFAEVKDLFGVIIVSQPTKISNTGLIRTIDLLRVKQIPILGLVANLDGFLVSNGKIEYQFLSPRVDLKAVAEKAGIPFLVSIPQCGDWERAKPYFAELADKVVGASPVVLKEVTLTRKLKRKITKGIVRVM